MTPKFYNNLLYYCLNVRDTTESAELLAQEFILKFKSLDKWSQVNLSAIIDRGGFEKAFEVLDHELKI
jgi:hypothetical protein